MTRFEISLENGLCKLLFVMVRVMKKLNDKNAVILIRPLRF